MKSYRDMLAEAKVIEVIEGASSADAKKIKKVLDSIEAKYKQKGNAFKITFADKLQKEVIDSTLSNDRKINLA